MWAILTAPGRDGNRWDPEQFFRSGIDEVAALMAYVASLGVELPRRRALDFGCGIGRLTRALARHFDEAWGVDISPSMIRQAREWSRGEACRFVLNETDDLRQLPGAHFDLVYSNIVLQHVPPRHARRYLRELVRVLSPGGLLVFQLPAGPAAAGPAPAGLKARVKRLLPAPLRTAWDALRRWREFPRMDMYGLPREEVTRVVEDAGGRLVDVLPDESAGPAWPGYRYCVTR
jgi:SAM-dependent methyltransferase